MFENLSDKLNKAIKTLKGQGRISDINVAATVKEVRRALMDADVNYKVAKDVTDRVREKAIDRKVMIAVEPGQLFVKIVQEELMELMGGQAQSINLKGSPAVILIAGLQGSGKTTFSGKFASYLKKQGRQVLLVACDVYRPAAITQLQVLGEQIGVEVFAEPENKNAVDIAKNALAYAKTKGKSVVIVDTAGRLAVDEVMMKEVEDIKKTVSPSEILFVVDSMTGQDAVNTAKTFNERLTSSLARRRSAVLTRWRARRWGKWSCASHSNATRPTPRSSWTTATPHRVCCRVRARRFTTTRQAAWKGTARSKRCGLATRNATAGWSR